MPTLVHPYIDLMCHYSKHFTYYILLGSWFHSPILLFRNQCLPNLLIFYFLFFFEIHLCLFFSWLFKFFLLISPSERLVSSWLGKDDYGKKSFPGCRILSIRGTKGKRKWRKKGEGAKKKAGDGHTCYYGRRLTGDEVWRGRGSWLCELVRGRGRVAVGREMRVGSVERRLRMTCGGKGVLILYSRGGGL